MIIVIKSMNKYLHYLFSPFYLSLGFIVDSVIILVIFPQFRNFRDYSQYELMIVVLIGISNVIVQVLLSIATKLENVTILAPLHYIEVLIVLLCDLVFFHVIFDIIDIIGMSVISI